MIFLLDVNVLVAMAWPHHKQHRPVHLWREGLAGDQWSTCPITQCGFVRISSNPAFSSEAVSPQEALVMLEQITAQPSHVFWEDHVSLGASTSFPRAAIRGHNQVTDAYLLTLCLERSGRLATLDQGILSLAVTAEQRAAILVLPA